MWNKMKKMWSKIDFDVFLKYVRVYVDIVSCCAKYLLQILFLQLNGSWVGLCCLSSTLYFSFGLLFPFQNNCTDAVIRPVLWNTEHPIQCCNACLGWRRHICAVGKLLRSSDWLWFIWKIAVKTVVLLCLFWHCRLTGHDWLCRRVVV